MIIPMSPTRPLQPRLESPLVGLYVHIPFCDSKCGYCDFYSVAVEGRDTHGFVARLIRELKLRCSGLNKQISTVFYGGGTPTILPSDALEQLFLTTREIVDVDRLDEFTVEANPATIDDHKARLMVDHGVTRVSLGAQSFFQSELSSLERLHSPGDIAPSVDTLRRAGVREVNLDLIFGIPGQSLETWSESLSRAIDLGADHIACYGLTYEPNTRLTAMKRHGRLTPCDEDLEADMYLFAIDRLERAGYAQYEISNFAKPGCQSRHNLIYWRNEPYLGVGPSAVGCINHRRYKNVSDVGLYIRRMDEFGEAEVESEFVDESMRVTEIILMQLRLNEGISVNRFRERVGVDPAQRLNPALDGLIARGLLTATDSAIALTKAGRLVANRVMAELVPTNRTRLRPTRLDIPLPILGQVDQALTTSQTVNG